MRPEPTSHEPTSAEPHRHSDRVVVIGAGVAGLTAARALRDVAQVTVLEKGRGVGGRLATRRIGEATLDHGAQFITTHTPEFAAVVTGWQAAGVVAPWFAGRVGPEGVAEADGHVRFRGAVGMTSIAKHLAVGTDVRLSTRVVRISSAVPEAATPWSVAPWSVAPWSVALDDGTVLDADALIVTAPLPQALVLLDEGGVVLSPPDRARLDAVDYEPCLAALVPLDGPSGLPNPGAVTPEVGPIGWMADNATKGVSAVPAVTIHADAEFSWSHWDDSDAAILTGLLGAANLASRPLLDAAQVQRWRYARPANPDDGLFLLAAEGAPLAFAGDAFAGAKVEGAARSGAAVAVAVAAALAAVAARRGGGATP